MVGYRKEAAGASRAALADIWYEETDDTVVLQTDSRTEWLESDTVVRLPDRV